MKPIAQKQPGAQLSLPGPEETWAKLSQGQAFPLHNRPLNLSCPDVASWIEFAFWGTEVPSENQSAGLLKRILEAIALFIGNEHKQAGKVGSSSEHHQLELPAQRISGTTLWNYTFIFLRAKYKITQKIFIREPWIKKEEAEQTKQQTRKGEKANKLLTV